MTQADLPSCEAIGDAVHVAHPEDEGRMAQKFALFPRGCLVLRHGARVAGYAVSFPWTASRAIALNAATGRLPDAPDTLYLHDLALLPAARGTGAGRAAVQYLAALARSLGLPTVSLVAVGGTSGFWERVGFATVSVPDLAPVLGTYDPGARYMVRPVQVAEARVASSAAWSM